MQFNPFLAQVDQLSVELERLSVAINQVQKDCLRYDQFDLAHVQAQIRSASIALPERLEKWEGLNRQLTAANSEVEQLRRRASLGINPMFWFSDERKRLKRQRSEMLEVRESLAAAVKAAFASMQKAEGFSKQASLAMEWYVAFDRASEGAHVETLRHRIGEIECQLPTLRQKSDALDAELTPILHDLALQQTRRREAETRIAAAQRYEARLNNASNSYERHIAHEACRVELGNSSPSQVVGRGTREKESAERSIDKITRRLQQVAERHSRRFDRLVFDGNNLCHDKQGKFIGLGALKAILASLQTQARMILVFDESIKVRHGLDEERIRHALGAGVTVHIVSGAADETVLNLAQDEYSYVISNDNFVEYRSKSAVRQRRIFSHETVDSRVMIHALGVSASYE